MTARSLPSPSLRVLVVEDNFLAAEAISLMLGDLGHEVVGPVSTIHDALTTLERHAIDVAVLDVDIRGHPVIPVARRLRERDCPILFLTSYGNMESLPVAYRSAPRVTKPLSDDDLELGLSAALGAED